MPITLDTYYFAVNPSVVDSGSPIYIFYSFTDSSTGVAATCYDGPAYLQVGSTTTYSVRLESQQDIYLWLSTNSSSYVDANLRFNDGNKCFCLSSLNLTLNVAEVSAVSIAAKGNKAIDQLHIGSDYYDITLPPDTQFGKVKSVNNITPDSNGNVTVGISGGTVTSVGAGTGLSISGTATVNPTVNIASGYKLPTTTEWNNIPQGTVTSVGATSGSNIAIGGTAASPTVGVASGYSIPSTSNQTAWSNKYSKPSGGIPASDLAETYYLASNPNGYTSNAGTVTSVGTGTGLNISGTATVNPTVNVDSNYKLPTNTEWGERLHYCDTLSSVAGSGTSGSYLSVRWYTSGIDGITTPYNGMRIWVKVPLAGVSTAGVVLSINGNNNADYYPVVYNVNTVLTSHFPANSYKCLVFTTDNPNNVNGYLTSNTATKFTSYWHADANYDTNTTMTYGTLAYYFRPYVNEAVYRYKLVMLDKDNRLVPLSKTNLTETAYSDYASSTTYAKDVVVHRTGKWYKSLAASNKGHTPESSATWWSEIVPNTPTSTPFRPDKIYWYNTTTNISAGTVMGGNVLMDIGYNQPYLAYCNFNEGMLAYRMIYLCGTYNATTGLFTLRDGGTAGSKLYYTTVPTNTANITLSSYFTSGYDYILVGGTYSSNNYVHLRDDHPMYHFDGTNLVPYDTWYTTQSAGPSNYLVSASASGNTLTITPNSGSAVTFTPTFTEQHVGDVVTVGATANSGINIAGTTANPTVGIASGYKLPTTTEWNSKGTYSKPSGGIPATDLAESYYLASNPNGYTSNTGTVTSVNGITPVNGNVTLQIFSIPDASFLYDIDEGDYVSSITAAQYAILATADAFDVTDDGNTTYRYYRSVNDQGATNDPLRFVTHMNFSNTVEEIIVYTNYTVVHTTYKMIRGYNASSPYIIRTISQTDYNNLGTKDPYTIYIII